MQRERARVGAGGIEIISVYHSRHDESLLPRLSQHPVHEQRRVGEGVLVPLPPFIEAQPGKHKQLLR